MKHCTVENCSEAHYGLGFCKNHWRRYKRHGTPTGGRIKRGEAQEELRRILASETDDCVLWPYSTTRAGYGFMTYKGKQKVVSRLVCEIAHGLPVDPKLHAAHTCGAPLCCNPRHLRWATPSENMQDKTMHGTMHRGVAHKDAKLNPSEVRKIRERLKTETRAAIAADYGLGSSTISNIALKKTWAWVN